MFSLQALAYGLLTASFCAQVQAQDETRSTMVYPYRSASVCSPDTTSCGDFGRGTQTVTVGSTETETTLEVRTFHAKFTKTIVKIEPTIITKTRSSLGFCKIVTTTTTTTPVTTTKTEYTTTTLNEFIDETSTSTKIYYETVDPVADCIISVLNPSIDLPVEPTPTPSEPIFSILSGQAAPTADADRVEIEDEI